MQGFYNECPSLLFIDPWGYKHINTRVLTQFLTQWGNEVFIFINTKRLNAAFENNLFQEDLKIVFPLTYNEVREDKKLQGTVEERVTSGTGTVSHYGEQTLGTLHLNARADGIGAEYLIIYRGIS